MIYLLDNCVSFPHKLSAPYIQWRGPLIDTGIICLAQGLVSCEMRQWPWRLAGYKWSSRGGGLLENEWAILMEGVKSYLRWWFPVWREWGGAL